MVMFNCNRCSAGMKKKEVENHSFKCGGKSNINVTCIDCLKDFRGKEYESHTSCLTEEQRYNGKGAVTKTTGIKQNQWLGIVKRVLKQKDSLDKDVVGFLKSVQHHENIPRNRKKFQNWAFSAKLIKDSAFLDKVFDILRAEFDKSRQTDKVDKNEPPVDMPAEESEAKQSSKIDDSLTSKPKKSKKRKTSESGVDNGNITTEDAEPVDNQNVENALGCDAEKKLSKKEMKLLKKKAKYEQEVKEIESAIVEEPPSQAEEVEPVKKSKKSKKRKLAEVDENVENIDDSKKKKMVEENSEVDKTDDSPLHGDSGSPKNMKTKFNWHETIIEVVKQSKNNEISLKKLAKKVINEYISRYGDSGIQEKLQAKLNKKVTNCPGIKVLKDRAKLVERED